MDKDLFADLLVSLGETVEYAKGNETKGRSMLTDLLYTVTVKQRIVLKGLAV
jgi:hypothetical protein